MHALLAFTLLRYALYIFILSFYFFSWFSSHKKKEARTRNEFCSLLFYNSTRFFCVCVNPEGSKEENFFHFLFPTWKILFFKKIQRVQLGIDLRIESKWKLQTFYLLQTKSLSNFDGFKRFMSCYKVKTNSSKRLDYFNAFGFI